MKILNKLTIKHLKSNPKRTIVTIIGIILSTSLMVGIGLLLSTVRDLMVQTVEQESGTHHVIIDVPKDKIDIVSKNQNVLEYSYKSSLGFSNYEGIVNEYKPYIQLFGASSNYLQSLNLLEGELPTNDDEIVISHHLIYNAGLDLKIGDVITLDVGKRVDISGMELHNTPFTNEKIYTDADNFEWIINEKIIDKVKKEYKIVGICERDKNESYSNPGYSAFTIGTGDILNVYINFKNIKNTYKYTNSIATNLGYKELSEDNFNEVKYNSSLLSINGVTKYNNVTESLSLVICIVLSLISIACIIVIYNSFAISVMERKKQFGLFASIGTTRKQLRYTVFYEAFIVGLIGIPLGIISAYIGIGVVLAIIGDLLPFTAEFEFGLVTYPLFIIIPVIFMIITILVSAYLPAKRASKVSPIEAIRQNDDIKIKSKKVKSPKFINKLFGVEGDIAYKNMKRNKKKYRITIVSLFISIVLFVSFSSLIKYGLEGAVDFTELPDYEYVIYSYPKPDDEIEANEVIDKILHIEDIKQASVIQTLYMYTDGVNVEYTKEFLDKGLFKNTSIGYVEIITLNKEYYEEYKKQIGLKDNRPIVINRCQEIVYTDNSRKSISANIFNRVDDFNVSYYDYENEKLYDKKYAINNVYLTDVYPFGITEVYSSSLTVILDEDKFNEIFSDENNDQVESKNVFIVASKYDEINKIVSDNSDLGFNYYNIKEEMKMVTNIILVVKILLYGFISLVTLIGVTSVLNTINTSIALRRKEFAVLRSIGLTPKGFNKMLFFESLFFGLKSLFYGIPVGIFVTLLLHLSMSDIVEFNHFMIPYGSILIAIIGVFIIVMLSQWYATRKIKKENILDAIREENI